ncbi:MAG: hypothetical protein JO199_08785 [Candidatus Eremiobacteraeota bacterium]|nr:hypothetical protein [Candidatus Eremiobacteraeota bacterium]
MAVRWGPGSLPSLASLAMVAGLVSGCGPTVSPGSIVPQAIRDRNLAPPGTNLLIDGDAEMGDATLTGYDSVTIPAWLESGLPTVVAYGVRGFPNARTPGAGNGKNFFTGGPFGSSTLTQALDLTSAFAAIDGGGVTWKLSGLLGGKKTSKDHARVTATFRNAAGSALGAVTIGPVTNLQRGNATKFLLRTASAKVPRHTRSVVVTLAFTQYEAFYEGATLDNGYADDLAFSLSTPVAMPTLPPPPVSKVPKYDHVFFVYFENSNFDQIVGNVKKAPYINAIAKQYSLLGNYYALHHPSDANYVLQAAGGTYGLHQNNFQQQPLAATHLADLVERAHGTWKQYMESADGPCDMHRHGSYYPDDGPYMFFDDVRYDKARCEAHVVPWSQWATDLNSTATTPEYAWLSPDDCDDMEGCGTTAGDNFLKNDIMKPLLVSPAWQHQKTLLIVAWDEDDFTPINHIPGIFVASDGVKSGFRSEVLYTHYSILKTIELALNLPELTRNDAYATFVNDVWK